MVCLTDIHLAMTLHHHSEDIARILADNDSLKDQTILLYAKPQKL